MRPSCLGALLFTILLLVVTGCHQANGTAVGTPTTPIGPLAPTSPNSGAIGPSLGPFGAPTRVPPPATGSYGTPNNYMGGSAPNGQAFQPRPSQPNFASADQRLQPLAAPSSAAPLRAVGSGVQQSAWTDPRTQASGAATASSSAPSSSRPNTGAAGQPRLGGLPVNDLTGAPPPPGYRPQSRPSLPPRNPTAAGAAGTFRGYRQSNTGRRSPTAAGNSTSIDVGITTSSERSSAGALMRDRSGAAAVRSQAGSPVTAGGSSTAAVPREPVSSLPAGRGGQPAHGDTPSTEPASTQTASETDPNLPWRRPGSQY